MKWQDLDANRQRKAVILGGIVALAFIVLLWPRNVSVPHPPARPKPSPMGKAKAAQTSAPRAVPAPDPLAKLLGNWQGRESLGGRGVCLLSLELKPGQDRQNYAGFSTFACTGNAVPGTSKDPVGLGTMMQRAINTTSASFSGTVQEGGIALRATDNIGVDEAAQGCAMVSMTLKAFGDARLSVRWQESGKPECTGGEMLLTHAR